MKLVARIGILVVIASTVLIVMSFAWLPGISGGMGGSASAIGLATEVPCVRIIPLWKAPNYSVSYTLRILASASPPTCRIIIAITSPSKVKRLEVVSSKVMIGKAPLSELEKALSRAVIACNSTSRLDCSLSNLRGKVAIAAILCPTRPCNWSIAVAPYFKALQGVSATTLYPALAVGIALATYGIVAQVRESKRFK